MDNEIIVSIALWIAGFLMLGIGFSIIESWSLGGIVTILFGSGAVIAGIINIIKNV